MTPSPVTDTKVCFVGIAQSLMPSPVTDTKVCFVGIAQSLTLATPWTVAHQVPLSMRFPRQENWSGLPFPSLGDLPNPGFGRRHLRLGLCSEGESGSFLLHLGTPKGPQQVQTNYKFTPSRPT